MKKCFLQEKNHKIDLSSEASEASNSSTSKPYYLTSNKIFNVLRGKTLKLPKSKDTIK